MADIGKFNWPLVMFCNIIEITHAMVLSNDETTTIYHVLGRDSCLYQLS